MIDIHSHILYGVDDGCQTLDDSLRMIKKAISVGVTDIICTPHYRPIKEYLHDSNDILEKFNILKEEIKENNLNINLFLGREIDKNDDFLELMKNKMISTMNNTKYVLIDFGIEKCDIDEYCYELIINGYIPIIAHPERYNYVSDMKLYKKWKKTGALIQINAASLLHTHSKEVMKKAKHLLKEGLVDFIASDAHMNESSFDYLHKSIQIIKKKYPKNIIKNRLLLEGVN